VVVERGVEYVITVSVRSRTTSRPGSAASFEVTLIRDSNARSTRIAPPEARSTGIVLRPLARVVVGGRQQILSEQRAAAP
jgi:hypothetical protein